MKRNRVVFLLSMICLTCAIALFCASCEPTETKQQPTAYTITFIADGKTHATITTAGNEKITLPANPIKEGYTFDGWYVDEGTWQSPFTASLLLSEPLTADMFVYAKFTEIHTHSLILKSANEATCITQGNEVYYTCSCGKLFSDEQGNRELTAIPTIQIVAHTPSEWINDNAPTCTANGSKHIECAACHTLLQTEIINANGHTPETTWIIDSNATCTANGFKHLECSVCSATMQTETIPATGHAYSNEWVSDKNGHWQVATCEHTSETTEIESHVYDNNYQCVVCKYQDTSLRGTAIATEVFKVDGEMLYVKVPNNQTTFSFINSIQVADDATFVVAADLATSNIISTKIVSLETGDNTYYICVKNGNDTQLYTATLRRRPIYNVTFATNGGTVCDSQKVEEDGLAIEPITTRIGYTVASWDYDFRQPITVDTTITASWTANEYTVTYDVNGGVSIETEYTATYDKAYVLAVPTREGHTFSGWYIDEIKITDANGQSVTEWTYVENKTVTAQWSINSYTLTITNPNNSAGTVTGAGTQVYNSEVTVTATEPNLGYKWIGWYIGNELISMELTCTFNMPATNLTLTPYKLKDEMAAFNFTSTLTTCIITGVKNDRTMGITIPTYVTSIAGSAFDLCMYVVSVKWNAIDCAISRNSSPFAGCWSLSSVEIGDEVISLPPHVFDNIEELKRIKIGNSVTTIGSYAFYGCGKLTSVTIPDSVTSIGARAFNNCSGLTSIILGNSVATIGEAAFADCSGLTSIVIPNSVTTIGASAFFYCSKLTSVAIGNGVITIGDNAFYGCSKLTSVTIPDSVTTIGASAFSYCSSLTSVVIPVSVTSIGNSAFYNYNSSNLTSVYYKGTADDWANISIGDNPHLVNAVRYYYRETEPELNIDGTAYDGNYWHYDENGEIVVWTKEQ